MPPPGPAGDDVRPAVAPTHTDWLFHHLRIEGPAAALAAFRDAAAGTGVIPWHLDLDRVEEDAFLRLATRDAVARRHALAVARVGHDRPRCIDLHALVSVPGDILRLGPDHPAALMWLWTHWGTTEALRRAAPAPDRDETAPPETVMRISFWSADCGRRGGRSPRLGRASQGCSSTCSRIMSASDGDHDRRRPGRRRRCA